MIPVLLTRWRWAAGIAAGLVLFGLFAALHHYRGAYRLEKALRAADRAAYTQAQAEATRIAYDAMRHQEHIYVTKAKESEHEYVVKIADARSRAAAYIDRMRIKAAPGDASGTSTRAESGGAQSAERSGSAAILVAVTAADVDVCTTNTVRLDAAREWALGLKTGL